MSGTENSDIETSNPNTETPNPSQSVFPAELAAQFAEFLRQSLGSIPNSNKNPPAKTHHPESLGEIIVKAKLDGENYPLWANLMDRAIGGKGLTSHIDGWQQRDHCVFNWIINNIESELVNEVSQYATAKELWEGLAVTYGSGADPLQVYDLHRQTNNIKQEGMTLEALWNKFQNLWISIDRREPNPMEYKSEIEKYNQIVQKQRLYQFLVALDDKYEAVKKDIIRKNPLPTVHTAYGIVRRETTNSQIPGIGGCALTKEAQNQGIGSGLAASDRGRQPPGATSRPGYRRPDDDKSRLSCSHCGGKKHTREGCFLLIGFPDWWDEMKRARTARGSNRGSRAAAVVGDRAADAGKSTGSSGAAHSSEGDERRSGEEGTSASARAFGPKPWLLQYTS